MRTNREIYEGGAGLTRQAAVFSGSRLGLLSGTIHWGDGTSSPATLTADGDGGNYDISPGDAGHAYMATGSYSGYVVVNDAGGSSTTVSFSAVVIPTAPLDAGNPETIVATEGQTFTGEVGTFIDESGDSSHAGDLSAVINWGDGNTTTVTPVALGGGQYSIVGTNIYAGSGTLDGTVQVTEGDGTSTAALTFTAEVAAAIGAPGPAIIPGPYTTIATTEGGLGFTGQVATFTDANPGSLSATINWGDGNTSTVTPVALGNGTYGVQGSNTYESQQSFLGNVQVTDSAGGSANIGFAASVGSYAALQAGSPETIYADTGQSLTSEVATFTDIAGDPSAFSATIDWGNSDTSQATLVPLGGGTYSVQGTEAYGQSGSYAGTVTVTDEAGDGVAIGFTGDVGSYAPSNNALPGAGSGITPNAARNTTITIRPGVGTLAAALRGVSAFRQTNHLGANAVVTIDMKPGTYSLLPGSMEPISAGGSADAGTLEPVQVVNSTQNSDSYVTIEGNGSTLSGGASLTGWTAVSSTPREYSASAGSLGVFRSLFVEVAGNYVRAQRATDAAYADEPIGTRTVNGADANVYGTPHADGEWMPAATGTAASASTMTTITDSANLTGPAGSYIGDWVSIAGVPGFFSVVTGYAQSTHTITFGASNALTASPANDAYALTPFNDNVDIPASDYPNLLNDFNNAGGGNPLEFVETHAYDQTRLPISGVAGVPSNNQPSYWKVTLSDLANVQPSQSDFQDPVQYYIDNYVTPSSTPRVPTLQPGQWYEDAATNTVYYRLLKGQSSKINAVAPEAIEGGGSLMQIGIPLSTSSPVQNFAVKDLNFEFASWTSATIADPAVSAGGYAGVQEGVFSTVPENAYKADGDMAGETPLLASYSTEVPALAIANATGTTIENCGFSHLDGAGLGLICQTSYTQIRGDCRFSDISGDAILVDGEQSYQDLTVVNSKDLPAGQPAYQSIAQFASNSDGIVNNTIKDCGVEFLDAAGILAGFAQGLTISSNKISNLPGAGIADGRFANSFNGESGGWAGSTPGSGTWCVSNIKSNTITNVGLVMTDTGGVYLSGCNWDFDNPDGPGTLIEHNTLTGIGNSSDLLAGRKAMYGLGGYPNGIYVDTGANGVSVLYNTVSKVEGTAPVFLNGVDLPGLYNMTSFPWPPIEPPPGALGGLTIDSGSTPPSNLAVQYWAYGNTYNGRAYRTIQ